MAELEALERGAPMSVMGPIRAAREVRAAAAKLDPADVNFGQSTGMARCGICANYRPADNPMYGTCDIVDKYRVERNQHCDRFAPANPSTGGNPGGAVARLGAAEVYNLLTAREQLLTANRALLGEVRVLRDQAVQRYGHQAPKMFARVTGGVY
jgi:hypothetical protein